MRKSEILRTMLDHTNALQSQVPSNSSKEAQATQNYIDFHNVMYEEEIRRQEVAEIQEEASASSANNFSVVIKSEVKKK